MDADGAPDLGGDGRGARGDVTDAWRDARRSGWCSRGPGHDVFFDQLTLPWFADLPPAAGRRRSTSLWRGPGGTVSGGRGHAVSGIPARRCCSPRLVTPAATKGSLSGDRRARPLPWDDDWLTWRSLQVLQDMTEPAACIARCARARAEQHLLPGDPQPGERPGDVAVPVFRRDAGRRDGRTQWADDGVRVGRSPALVLHRGAHRLAGS